MNNLRYGPFSLDPLIPFKLTCQVPHNYLGVFPTAQWVFLAISDCRDSCNQKLQHLSTRLTLITLLCGQLVASKITHPSWRTKKFTLQVWWKRKKKKRQKSTPNPTVSCWRHWAKNNCPWRHHWEAKPVKPGMTYQGHFIPVTCTWTQMCSAAISVILWAEIPLPGVWRTLIGVTGSFTQLMRSVKSTRQLLKRKCWQFPLKQKAPQPSR